MKNKLKDIFTNFNISEKSLNMITIFFILAICIIFYLLPYKKLNKTQVGLKNEIQALEEVYNQLVSDIPRKDEFEKGIKEGSKKLIGLDSQLPSELPQELIIQTIDDLEKTIGIKLPNVSLGTLQLLSNNNEVNISDEKTESINTLDSNGAIDQSSNNLSTNKEEIAIKVEVQSATVLNYTKLKELINYFKQGDLHDGYKKRVAINNLQLSSNHNTGEINTVFSLNFYGLQGKDEETHPVFLGEFNIGKPGVFIPIPEYGINLPKSTTLTIKETEPADFFIRLSSITADQTTVVVGTGNSGSNYVFADENTFIDAKIELTKVENKYYYKYQAGNDILTGETEYGNQFNPGKSLDLSILSSKRTVSDDKSGANVTIINNTDMMLNIRKFNDDTASPRFKLIKTEGKVNIW